ncbi:is6110%2C transposase [Mycobacterium tuberculosis]|nr:is6110%2C transposase [Mycobacterium tuberculosis]
MSYSYFVELPRLEDIEPGAHTDVLIANSRVDQGRMNRPGMSGDSSSWKGWGHVRWFIEEVPAGAA